MGDQVITEFYQNKNFFWIVRPFYDKILGRKGNNPECLSRLTNKL